MSRQELAEAVSRLLDRPVDAKFIGRLESGEVRWPGRDRREALRVVLGAATDAELGLFVDRPERTQSQSLDGPAAVGQARRGVALMVSIAVVLNGGSVLLVRRRDGDPGGLTWQFPAGVVKPGVMPVTVAVRETLAETGVHCLARTSLGRRVHPLTRVHCEYFLCDYLAGEVTNLDLDENLAAIWVPTDDVSRFIPTDRLFEPVARALEGRNMAEPVAENRSTIAAAVIVADGKLLLARRRAAEGDLSWQFPAGQVEPGETAELAAARETLEEVGLVVEPVATLGQRVHPKTGRTMIYVACTVTGGEARVVDDDELAEVEWCGPDRVAAHVPYGFYGPVEEYLASCLR
jgi:8-oxo-dGTP pyrophosphatase MutT (NUDIX family)